MTVLEVAQISVLAGHEKSFVADLARASDTVLPRAEGFQGFVAHGWCVERPNVFMFTIVWESIDHHMVGFRNSELFTEWRALIGAHMDGAPLVEHFSQGV